MFDWTIITFLKLYYNLKIKNSSRHQDAAFEHFLHETTLSANTNSISNSCDKIFTGVPSCRWGQN